jgi:hypothetical protein
MENLDARLLRNQEEEREAAQELKSQRSGVSNETEDTSGSESLRERAMQARQVLNIKEQAKKKIEEKVAAPVVGMLKTKLLNFIPGYGPYVAFKQFISGQKSKFNLVDIIIMLFSNLNACFMVLGVLALIALIVTFATNPLAAVKAIMDLGWSGISALVNLFKGLLS